MQVQRIESADDPRLDDYRDLKRRSHDEHVVVESRAVVARLVDASCTVRSLVVTPQLADEFAPLGASTSAAVYVVERDVLATLAGYDVHRGVLAAVDRPAMPSLAEVLGSARRLVVLEGSNDLENIGAVARSARALGVDALVLDPTCADPFARRSVRVSMGELLRIPVVRCTAWPDALDEMTAAGFAVWALSLGADARSLLDVIRAPGSPPERIAVLAGAEGPGLTTASLARASHHVRIPMHHGVDSLNLGHALAIAMAAVSPAEPG